MMQKMETIVIGTIICSRADVLWARKLPPALSDGGGCPKMDTVAALQKTISHTLPVLMKVNVRQLQVWPRSDSAALSAANAILPAKCEPVARGPTCERTRAAILIADRGN